MRLRRDRRVAVALGLVALAVATLVWFIGLDFLWESGRMIARLWGSEWQPGRGAFGMAALLLGSLVVATGSLAVAFPIGLAVSLYLTEFSGGAARRLLLITLQVLAGLPSVVIGTCGVLFLLPFVGRTVGLGGLGLFVTILLLALLLLPTISSLCAVAIEALPPGYREGAVALGASRWQAVRRLLLPAARVGLGQAAVLAFGRALGETMIVVLVSKNFPSGFLQAFPFLRPITATLVMEVPYATGEHRAALFGAGAVLLLLILLVNGLARRIGRG